VLLSDNLHIPFVPLLSKNSVLSMLFKKIMTFFVVVATVDTEA
jgi:hypothetical protein